MEPTTGIEPVNLFLTKEALYLLSYVGITTHPYYIGDTYSLNKDGAGDEARTRDIQLGRLKLYQLSYSRSKGCNSSYHEYSPESWIRSGNLAS